jgi:hypothetical protein
MATEYYDKTRFISPIGSLGGGINGPALDEALAQAPYFIACDGGTTDAGPFSLGIGTPAFHREAVKRDLSLILRAGRKANIPVIIGSASTAGGDVHVERVLDIAHVCENCGTEDEGSRQDFVCPRASGRDPHDFPRTSGVRHSDYPHEQPVGLLLSCLSFGVVSNAYASSCGWVRLFPGGVVSVGIFRPRTCGLTLEQISNWRRRLLLAAIYPSLRQQLCRQGSGCANEFIDANPDPR